MKRHLLLAAIGIQLVSSVVGAALRADYDIIPGRENDKPAVKAISLTVNASSESGSADWQMDVQLAAGGTMAIRCRSERPPMTSPRGPGRFKSYQFRDPRGKVTEYRHALTGEPLLPMIHFTDALLPTCRPHTPMRDGFIIMGEYLGQIARLSKVDTVADSPAWKPDFSLALNPDVMIGILWSMKDDGSGMHEDKDYRYLPLEPADYKEMIAAGCNYFGPATKTRECLQDEPVYFLLAPDFPADLYRSNYAGMDMFIDEPAIRLGLTTQNLPQFRHPSEVAELLVTRGRAIYGRDGLPYAVHNAIKAKWPMGTMDLRVDGIPAWETMYPAAFYEMAGGIEGIVQEGRYQREGFDWEPSVLLGGAVELTPEQGLRCQFATMRGAARAFGQHWGMSIYGQCHPDLREPSLKLAYEMGAKWFWFWSADHDHHLPHVEKLKLMRAFRDYVRTHPRADLATVRRSARTAVAFPWGYCLSWRSFYALGAFLDLNVSNPQGVPYREPVAAAAWEGILCALQGEDFDFTIDHPGLDKLGYQRILRVDERGVVHESPERITASPSLRLSVQAGPGSRVPDVTPALPLFTCSARHGRPIRIDSDISDWDGPWISLPSGEIKTTGTTAGPQDLSARVGLGYDDRYFYLVADVSDDVHYQPNERVNIWDGDCLQIALDPLNTRDKDAYTQHQYEIGFALGDDGKVLLQHWQDPAFPPGEIEGSQVKVRRDEATRHTYYEVALPFDQLKDLVAARTCAGICLVIADADNTGTEDKTARHRKAFIETSLGAVTNGKHPAKFGTMRFEPPDPKAAAVPGSWALVVPGSHVVKSGGTLTWAIQTVVPGDRLAGMEVRAAIESLSPAPATHTEAGARFDAGHRLETRDVTVRVDCPPGRYRLGLSAFGPQRQLLTRTQQTIFIVPADK